MHHSQEESAAINKKDEFLISVFTGALEEKEAWLEVALASAEVGVWSWNVVSGEIFWSPESFAIYGLDRESGPVTFETWRKCVCLQDFPQVNKALGDALQGRVPEYRAEFRILHPHRGIRWLLSKGRVVANENRRSLSLFGIHMDITRSKVAEQALRASEERYRGLVELSPEAILVNEDDSITFVNPAALSLFGAKEPAAILGRSPFDLFHPTYHAAMRTRIEKLLNGKRVPMVESQIVRLDGEVRDVEVAACPFTGADGIAIQVILRDSTERKRAENELTRAKERLLLAQKAAAIGTFEWNVKSMEIVWAEGMEQVYGVPAGELGASYQSWRQRVHAEDLERVERLIAEALAGRAEYNTEYRIYRADGSIGWVRARAQVQCDAEGNALRMIGFNMDITARKELERSLREAAVNKERLLDSERAARADAEHANRLKDEFLSIVSHELRTPLNAMLGWARLLKAGKVQPEKAIPIIERSAEAQARLIEDLLDSGRILSGKLQVERRPVDLGIVLGSALEAVRPDAGEKKLRLTARIDFAGCNVSGDASRLQQVISNLLNNAIKFTPADGAVTLTAGVQGSQAVIAVSDTGEGIDPAFMPNLFERFRQADASSTRKHRGLGLGLALSRHIIELHGGTIEAASAGPGKGACFTVYLPLHQLAAGAARREPVALRIKSGLTIMVVDDERDALELLRHILEEHGVRVLCFEKARDALAALAQAAGEQTFPDLIISDIGMPEMDGYTFAAGIKARGDGAEKIPLVALTAFARREDQGKALSSGFDRHLPKPVQVPALYRTIAELVEKNPAADTGWGI